MTDPNLPKNGPNQAAPAYGTPEYAEWWHRNYGGRQMPPPPPAQKPKRKRSRKRDLLIGTPIVVISAAVVVGLAQNGGKDGNDLAAQQHKSANASMVPCVNSANMCPADDPTDPSVTDDPTTAAPTSRYDRYVALADAAGYDPADEDTAKGLAGSMCSASLSTINAAVKGVYDEDKGDAGKLTNAGLVIRAYCPGTYPAYKAAVAAAKQPPAPKVLLDVSGNGIKNTAEFTTTGPWELHYSYDCSNFLDGTGNFMVDAVGSDGNTDYLVNGLSGGESAVSNSYQTGTQHLEINSECNWTVKVIQPAS